MKGADVNRRAIQGRTYRKYDNTIIVEGDTYKLLAAGMAYAEI
jgi:hypothetical protein